MVINEVAWAGTNASPLHEWMELHNPGPNPVSLDGWTLTDGDNLTVVFPPGTTILPGAFYLMERSSDQVVSDIPADFIYPGDLFDGGETLTLSDSAGQVVDTANGNGGPWPGGSSSPIASMERRDPLAPDSDSNWATNDGFHRNGLDAVGQPINGTPRMPNSTVAPTATPSPTSTLSPTPSASPTATATSTVTDTSTPTASPLPKATATPTPSTTAAPPATDTPTPSRTPVATATETIEPTATPSPSPTASPTSTATDSSTQTPTPTLTPTSVSPLAVIINELGWAGTEASAFDEWIELHNPGGSAISLEGWVLTDGGDLLLHFPAGLSIPAGGFLLLERTDDTSISDITADLIYTGGLNNDGELLQLLDPLGNEVDTANGAGGWPAGDSETHASMERLTAGPDAPGNWATNFGHVVTGHDRDGNPIRGTPREPNSALVPTPTPTAIPDGLALNEFLPHPESGDEFIELHNFGNSLIDLSGFSLDDAEGGTSPYQIPDGTLISPGQFLVFFDGQTGVGLNDEGDTVRLLAPDDAVLDQVTYDDDPGLGVAWSRLPDGTGPWNSRSLPTPGFANQAILVPPTATPPPASVAREWSDGAWVTFTGRVAVPPGVLSTRLINLQDESGGLYVYLGSGDWPPMKVGMQVRVLGYLRTRSGQRELYVRNTWHVGVGAWEDVETPVSRRVTTGVIGTGALEGDLVTVEGRVVKVEENALWLDDGTGRARVFFGAATGVEVPPVRSGQVWRATGVVGEYTISTSLRPGYRLRVRFEEDVVKVRESGGGLLPESPPEGPEEPVEEPEDLPEVVPASAPKLFR